MVHLCMHYVCITYALRMHYVYITYALRMLYVCFMYAIVRIQSVSCLMDVCQPSQFHVWWMSANPVSLIVWWMSVNPVSFMSDGCLQIQSVSLTNLTSNMVSVKWCQCAGGRMKQSGALRMHYVCIASSEPPTLDISTIKTTKSWVKSKCAVNIP